MPSTELVAALVGQWEALPTRPARLSVGLSGGLDSTVLLHVFACLRTELGYGLAAVHVRHGLIPESATWAQPCQTLCDRLEVPLAVRDVVVRRDHPGGLEAAAREARHEALREGGSDALLVLAHHRDDQAETVLFRALRGAGVRGAGGMRVFDPRGGGIWRPLLDVPRHALLRYAQEHGLSWIEDPSNQDRRFSRNFLRLDVLPAIETRHPGASVGLARTGRLCAEAALLLEELADIDLAGMDGTAGGRHSRAMLEELSSSRLRNAMRRLLERAGSLMPDESRLREAERQVRLDTASAGLRVVVGSHAVCVYRHEWWIEPAALPPVPSLTRWDGYAPLTWGGGRLAGRSVTGEGVALARLPAGTWEVKSRGGGERFRLQADGPRKDLRKWLQEAGIAPWHRPLLPLLWAGGKLAWVAGVGVAAEFRCPPGAPGWLPEWSGPS